jgi:hypothetical protein
MSVYRYQGFWINPTGYAMSGGLVYVCTQPNSINPSNPTIPPSPLASLFTDSSGGTSLVNPVEVDGNGNFFFYAAPAAYTLVFFDPLGRMINPVVIPDIEVVSPGSGSVTSVGLTGDGVCLASSVTGSPVTSSGTLAPATATANANTVVAGPASGSAAPMTQRNLVAADLPAATGGAQGAIELAGDLGGTSSSPTVVGTHLSSNLPPTQGGAGGSTALGNVSGSVSMNGGANTSFLMTLVGNVTSSSVSSPVTGASYTFVVTQNSTGGWTFAWPGNFVDPPAISPDANSVSVSQFFFDGANFRPTGPGYATGH